MTPSGCAGRVAVVHHKLSLCGLFVLGVPHASLGVVVVKKVAQAQSLNLQTVLQDPAWREGGRTGLKVCFYFDIFRIRLGSLGKI